MTSAQTHRGGCGFCRHWSAGKCRHPEIGVPMDYQNARERGRPCGPIAALWEYMGVTL